MSEISSTKEKKEIFNKLSPWTLTQILALGSALGLRGFNNHTEK